MVFFPFSFSVNSFTLPEIHRMFFFRYTLYFSQKKAEFSASILPLLACWTSLPIWWVSVSNMSGIESQSQFSRHLGNKTFWRKFRAFLEKMKNLKISVVIECKIFPHIEIEDRWTPGAENHSRKMFRARKCLKELKKIMEGYPVYLKTYVANTILTNSKKGSSGLLLPLTDAVFHAKFCCGQNHTFHTKPTIYCEYGAKVISLTK